MLKIRKTFKYRLYPNRKQRECLLATLEVCRDLYNDALQERREAWKLCRKSITFAMQSAQLPACKAADAAMRGVYSQVLQDVLHRVDKTYQAFFRRGNGFPRFKGKGWFDSFTYPQAGFRVEASQVSLSKIGNVKIKLHRRLAGEVKTLTLKQENGKWYACFSCMVEVEPLPANDLNGKGLAGGMLAKSVQEAAWSSFIAKLSYKAESADRRLVKVNARGTSQPCPCGAPVPKKLWDRWHQCAACGLKTTRDQASALEILRRGLRLRTETPAIAGIALEASSFRYGA